MRRRGDGQQRTPPRACTPLDVAVVGAGYVGLVTAAGLARLGHRITVLETSAGRLAALRSGRIPFYEPQLADIVAGAASDGRLSVTADPGDALAGRDVILICVGTPLDAAGGVDLTQLRTASSVAAHHGGDATIAIRSTLPVGASTALSGWLKALDPGRVVTNPEFLREGSAVADFMAPTRIVIGTTDGDPTPGSRMLARMYAGLTTPVLITDYASAEMIKNASNAFLATRLTFINEIADLCATTGADVDRVIEGVGLDPRIGPGYLRPGIGFGGSCLPKELDSLTRLGRRKRLAVPLLRAAHSGNGVRAERIAKRLELLAAGLRGRRVALLGLSFKPHTDDLRSSPAIGLAQALLARGARIIAHDPAVGLERTRAIRGLERATDVSAAVRDAELVVLATEWPEYRNVDWRRMAALARRPLLFDGRNALDAAAIRDAGWEVARIGEADPRPSGAWSIGTVDAAPTRRRVLGRPRDAEGSQRPPRFMLYSHDAVGLGHVRRNLVIARALSELAPGASVLVASGAEGLENLWVAPGIDVLRLPGLRKDGAGRYVGRRLGLEPEAVVGLRGRILASAIEEFDPDVLLADKHPTGVDGELIRGLQALRRAGGRAALGLRDVLDDPDNAARDWRRAGSAAWVAEYYDAVLVYGMSSLLAPLPAELLSDDLERQVRFCGYVVDRPAAPARVPLDLPDRDERPIVLASVGGGEDGLPVLEAFIEACRGAAWRGVVVAGPHLAADKWGQLAEQSAAVGIRAFRSVPDVQRWFPYLGALVSMGGYNTLLEALASATPTVCVPRVRPRREQQVRARAFAEAGLLRVVEPTDLDGAQLRRALADAVATPRAAVAERVRAMLDLGGASVAAGALVELARGARRRGASPVVAGPRVTSPGPGGAPAEAAVR